MMTSPMYEDVDNIAPGISSIRTSRFVSKVSRTTYRVESVRRLNLSRR